MRISKSLFITLIMLILIITGMSVTVYAEECDHEWEYARSDQYKEISTLEHSYREFYICQQCSQYKYETVKDEHVWDRLNYNIKSVSSTEHVTNGEFYCDFCGASKNETEYEKHKLDKFSCCEYCNYSKPGTISLKPGVTVYANAKTWIKIKVPQNGYLQFTSECICNLYDSSKKLISEWNNSGNISRIPVKAGTYYLRAHWNNGIRYLFKPVSPPKNLTKNTAKTLERGKTVTGVIYSSSSRKTWNRWYRIKLPKKQFLKLYYGNSNYFIPQVYNSKGIKIKMLDDYYRSIYLSQKKLPKGTYYIKLSRDWNRVEKQYTTGTVYSFKWK